MKRRYLLKQAGWLTAGSMLTGSAAAATINNKNKKSVLTIAHITDVHIRTLY